MTHSENDGKDTNATFMDERVSSVISVASFRKPWGANHEDICATCIYACGVVINNDHAFCLRGSSSREQQRPFLSCGRRKFGKATPLHSNREDMCATCKNISTCNIDKQLQSIMQVSN